MNRWEQGRAVVDGLVAARRLEHVPPSADRALSLIDKASIHLASAASLAATDVDLARTVIGRMPPY